MAKTNLGLVEYAKAQLGKPYWYGTYGQTATADLYKRKKAQYPQYYTATDFESQLGQRVHDCSGLPEGYLMSDTPTSAPKYNGAYDYSANGLRSACKVKGDIGTIPESPGVIVFYDGHMGVYIGGGEVIEARGHKYGVVKTKLSARPWKYWGKHPDLEYIEEKKEAVSSTELPHVAEFQQWLNDNYGGGLVIDGKPGPKTKAAAVRALQTICNKVNKAGLKVDGKFGPKTKTACKKLNIRRGDKGDAVYVVQGLLYCKGYDPKGFDGKFGPGCDAAVRKLQASNKLTADGIVGSNTWSTLAM